MPKFDTIGYRLKEERTRLGLSQAEAAGICVVHPVDKWDEYERCVYTPETGVLFHMAEYGADINYILTGHTLLA